MPDVLMGMDIFEVPEDIVDVASAVKECSGLYCELTNFVDVNLNQHQPGFIPKVKNGDEGKDPIDIWQLNSFIQD